MLSAGSDSELSNSASALRGLREESSAVVTAGRAAEDGPKQQPPPAAERAAPTPRPVQMGGGRVGMG